jgi:hypothetical protein
MLTEDYKDQIKIKQFKKARRIRLYNFLYRKKYKIILFILVLFVLLFPKTSGTVISNWYNTFITALK